MLAKLIYALLAALLAGVAQADFEQFPIIGIYDLDASANSTTQTYIPASYVKLLEASGVQTVPIFYHSSGQQILSLLSKINGVLFPGGNQLIKIGDKWTDKAKLIFDYAIAENKKGNVFPVWGTCLGFELIMYLTSGVLDSNQLFTKYDDSSIIHPLKLSFKQEDTQLFKNMNSQQMRVIVSAPGVMFFNHHNSISVRTFSQNSNLTGFWKPTTTTSINKQGYELEIISTIQAKSYPFYGTQYHPEKNPYEWRIDANRTSEAIRISQKLFNYFTSKARLNRNQFPQSEEHRLMRNYQAVAAPSSSDFTQKYIFNSTSSVI